MVGHPVHIRGITNIDRPYAYKEILTMKISKKVSVYIGIIEIYNVFIFDFYFIFETACDS